MREKDGSSCSRQNEQFQSAASMARISSFEIERQAVEIANPVQRIFVVSNDCTHATLVRVSANSSEELSHLFTP